MKKTLVAIAAASLLNCTSVERYPNTYWVQEQGIDVDLKIVKKQDWEYPGYVGIYRYSVKRDNTGGVIQDYHQVEVLEGYLTGRVWNHEMGHVREGIEGLEMHSTYAIQPKMRYLGTMLRR